MTEEAQFASDQERWAEQEAKFCDKMVEEFKRMSTEWTAKSHHPDSLFGAMRCAIYADAWYQMAGNLRKPRLCRVEHEHYTEVMKGQTDANAH